MFALDTIASSETQGNGSLFSSKGGTTNETEAAEDQLDHITPRMEDEVRTLQSEINQKFIKDTGAKSQRAREAIYESLAEQFEEDNDEYTSQVSHPETIEDFQEDELYRLMEEGYSREAAQRMIDEAYASDEDEDEVDPDAEFIDEERLPRSNSIGATQAHPNQATGMPMRAIAVIVALMPRLRVFKTRQTT